MMRKATGRSRHELSGFKGGRGGGTRRQASSLPRPREPASDRCWSMGTHIRTTTTYTVHPTMPMANLCGTRMGRSQLRGEAANTRVGDGRDRELALQPRIRATPSGGLRVFGLIEDGLEEALPLLLGLGRLIGHGLM